MKQLLIASLVLAALCIAPSCSKKAADAPAAPAADAPAADAKAADAKAADAKDAAPAADAPAADAKAADAPAADAPAADAKAADAPAANATPDFNEDGVRIATVRRNALEWDENNEGKPLSYKPENGGPAFDITSQGKSITFLRTDVPGFGPVKFEADAASEVYYDDFNYDGFTDFAFANLRADFDLYTVLLWNNGEQKFDSLEIGNTEIFGAIPANKTFMVCDLGYFSETPESCCAQYTFDGTKLVQKPWTLPAPKPGSVRVTVDSKCINSEQFRVNTMVFDFHQDPEYQGDDDGHVIGDPFGCTASAVVLEYTSLKGMIQKDVDGDGCMDLQFPSALNPSKMRTALWDKKLNKFTDFVCDPEVDSDCPLG